MDIKISKIKVFSVPLAYKTFGHSRLKNPQVALNDTIVKIETDQQFEGWGESCPLWPTYLPATAGSLRSALDMLAPVLIGKNPLHIREINHLMDKAMLGYEYAKAAIDMACHDLRGKFTQLPVKTLIGGQTQRSVPAYESVFIDTPEKMVAQIKTMRERGIKVFQVKLGESAQTDIERVRAIAEIIKNDETMICDANRGLTQADGLRLAAAINEIDPSVNIYMEQPCKTYEQTLKIKQVCEKPFVLDEVIDNLNDLMRAIADNALDVLVIKLSHAGGLSKALQMADVAINSGIKVRIEDTVGAEFVRSAVAHLAVTIPENMLLACYPHPAPVSLGQDNTILNSGRISIGNEPGLGVNPDLEVLNNPIAVYQ